MQPNASVCSNVDFADVTLYPRYTYRRLHDLSIAFRSSFKVSSLKLTTASELSRLELNEPGAQSITNFRTRPSCQAPNVFTTRTRIKLTTSTAYTTLGPTLFWKFWQGAKSSRTKQSMRASKTSLNGARRPLHHLRIRKKTGKMSRTICEALGLRRLTILETMVLLTVITTGTYSMSTVTLINVILGTALSYATMLSLPFLESAVDRLQG